MSWLWWKKSRIHIHITVILCMAVAYKSLPPPSTPPGSTWRKSFDLPPAHIPGVRGHHPFGGLLAAFSFDVFRSADWNELCDGSFDDTSSVMGTCWWSTLLSVCAHGHSRRISLVQLLLVELILGESCAKYQWHSTADRFTGRALTVLDRY